MTNSLLEKIQALPPEKLSEVEDFVDFLATKSLRLAAMDRFLSTAPAIEAAGFAPLDDTEIQSEIDKVRQECRVQSQRANHS